MYLKVEDNSNDLILPTFLSGACVACAFNFFFLLWIMMTFNTLLTSLFHILKIF
jgi:hypothetical protein